MVSLIVMIQAMLLGVMYTAFNVLFSYPKFYSV